MTEKEVQERARGMYGDLCAIQQVIMYNKEGFDIYRAMNAYIIINEIQSEIDANPEIFKVLQTYIFSLREVQRDNIKYFLENGALLGGRELYRDFGISGVRNDIRKDIVSFLSKNGGEEVYGGYAKPGVKGKLYSILRQDPLLASYFGDVKGDPVIAKYYSYVEEYNKLCGGEIELKDMSDKACYRLKGYVKDFLKKDITEKFAILLAQAIDKEFESKIKGLLDATTSDICGLLDDKAKKGKAAIEAEVGKDALEDSKIKPEGRDRELR